MHDSGLSFIFFEVSALVMLAAALGLAGLLLRQPLVVSFIAAGILAGPGALGIVQSTEMIAVLGQIAVAVLLFLVGLKLDVKLVRNLGAVAVATGLGQVGFTAIVGFLLCLVMGIDPLSSVYIAVALTFSSTIIIVKLLSDKHEIDSLHGQIALGFLIVQDIFVILAMVVVSALGFGGGEGETGLQEILLLAGGALALMAFVWVFVRWIANPLMALIARSQELLVIFAVGWAAGLAALADVIGLGQELGGLMAGVSLASTPIRDAIGARLAPLRDFLLLFFFIGLGAGLDLSTLGAQVAPAAVLSVFVLVGNPLIVLAILGFMGYRKRTGFLAGLTVAQISEFSLIFMAMGIALGHVDEGAMGLVTLVGLVTIALSVYMITWSHKLYVLCEPFLGVFERSAPYRENADSAPAEGEGPDVVILGLGRFGCRIGQGLKERGLEVLGVDFDPEALKAWRAQGMTAQFGDATDPEFVAHLPLARVRAVISAMPRGRGNVLSEADTQPALLHALKAAGYRGEVAVTVTRGAEADAYRDLGATLVLSPFEDAAERAVEKIAEACA
ncbi:cation:proton antiporter [Pararhodobacter aggregans]|uniref:Sodium:proton exchanger n=1 Tax=Pararhodobacter aggregans TaxID=404875 RepID=A0A2T7UJH5_9RHOB|nr:cation:proton antiporter family protein [Pararhodobacter aggregans]PTX02283.1 transporter (CPA2 family) [Pararhodobacter aggregans]PVE44819.1 sodium:proton exchanger [Pararhodobacter aggregans]